MLQGMRAATKWVWIFIAAAFVGGFLLMDTSGLMGRSAITPTTPVATVNGEDILATQWFNVSQQLEAEETRNSGRTLTLEERERLADQAYEQLVGEVLLRQEYRRRGIKVTNAEIENAARYNPPPQLMQSPELQTEGQFDPVKYQRFLASPLARQQGVLVQLESYYRSEIPKQKLFEQVVSDVYVSDERLWTFWRDTHDSAQVSFVSFLPESVPDSRVTVSDAEIRAFYDEHRKEFDRPARAVVSVMTIPRRITAADTAAARAKAVALKQQIESGSVTFENAARAESADTASGANGGDLGRGGRDRFVADFESAAYALTPGRVSEPVLTPFGYHLIKVDSRKGDTLSLRHILLRIEQREESAVLTDRRADSLARIAAAADDPAKFDEASRTLGIPVTRGTAIEGQPLTIAGAYVPSVAAWATGGASKGDISDLFDWDEGYAIARLDSLVEGGVPKLDDIKGEVRARIARGKKLDLLVADARTFATAAASSTLEQAAAARSLQVGKSDVFTRTTPAQGLGRLNEAVGAAFALPVGAVGAPVRTEDAVFVLRVDRRTQSDRAEFEAQKATLRQQQTSAYRQQRLQEFIQNLRDVADIDDNRKSVARAQAQAANLPALPLAP
ncbi:MAG: peptidylprolyl isomerase [Gemmatimonadaceae bacterium]|nr:peptidylprolyl isomerase [Gemmatimonadaceae bacterium]